MNPKRPIYHLFLHLRQPDGEYLNCGWDTRAIPRVSEILAISPNEWWVVEQVIHHSYSSDVDVEIIASPAEGIEFPLSQTLYPRDN